MESRGVLCHGTGVCRCRLYPVDRSRVNEFGESYEERPQRKLHAD